eukprot:TRINITY_DN2363_c0_g1_i1.p1 TRINITY_DN2363_c0_g1~~TRINITY_DN2363_c0_g1_i1.p1  ORF type:complete len:281 (-),score=83.91 TRINITY_DN2363_c0_g1_i1:681-1475(-)
MCIRDRYMGIQERYMVNKKMKKKNATEIFFSEYFGPSLLRKRKAGEVESPNSEGKISIKDMVWPFRKNSTNKTMNIQFLKMIFGSPRFIGDFMNFLDNYEREAEADNKSKIEVFASKVETIVRRGKAEEVANIRRMPWLKIWLENTRMIAMNLLQVYGNVDQSSKFLPVLGERQSFGLSLPSQRADSELNLFAFLEQEQLKNAKRMKFQEEHQLKHSQGERRYGQHVVTNSPTLVAEFNLPPSLSLPFNSTRSHNNTLRRRSLS